MGISDKIEAFITALLKEENDVQLKRNELASVFCCVPSQINYVIATRFNPERGYIVESRRGGGGYIRIRRVGADDVLSAAVAQVGEEIDAAAAKTLLEALCSRGALEAFAAQIMLSGISSEELENKDKLRASILKNMLSTYEIYKERT